MAATKKTGTTKKTNKKASARVLSEKELQTLIDAVPDERRKLAANIVSELVWMSKMKSARWNGSCRVNNPCCGKIPR